jgi:DNA repair protein RecO (recombination protein O)
MPYCKTEALIIDKSNYSETSQIVTCFTRNFGKVRLLAKGAKRPRNDFEGPLDLLQYRKITYIDKTNSRPGYGSGLSLLIDSKIQDGFPALRENLNRFYQATYVAEFMDELTPECEKHPELFELALNMLKELTMHDATQTNTLLLFSFESQAIKHLGYMPHTKACAQCSGKVTPGTNKTVLFSNQAGGVLCRNCAGKPQYNNQNITTNLSVLSLFNNLANSVTSSLERIKINEETTRGLRHLLRYYISCIAGKELKTFNYLS